MPFFKKSRARYYTPERTKSDIVIYLSPGQPPPSTVPPELQSCIPSVIWDDRIPRLADMTLRYNKPLLERTHFVFAIIASVIIPMFLHRAVRQALHSDDRTPSDFAKTRAVGFGIFCALVLVLFLPVVVWKFVGQRRVSSMLSGWAAEDRRAQGNAAIIPAWRCSTPTVFNSTAKLFITIPLARQPSHFHSDIYLAAKAYDAGNVPFVPPPRRPGDPHMSIIGRWSVQSSPKMAVHESQSAGRV